MVPRFPQLSETFIANKAVGLVGRGWDVQIVCSGSSQEQWGAFGPDHPVHCLKDRVHVTADLSKSVRLPSELLKSVSQLSSTSSEVIRSYLKDGSAPLANRAKDLLIDATIANLNPDIIHFEFGSLAVERMAIGRRCGAAVSVSFRGSDLNIIGIDDPCYYRDIWQHANGIHILGEALWQKALSRGALPETSHSAIPPALDASKITPAVPRDGCLGSQNDPLRLLSIGRLHWVKGYEYALEAVAELRQRGLNVEYRIIGDGPHLEAVAFWRHQLGLDDVVQLLLAVPPHEIASQLAWADVMIHTATSEGFCNAVLEAQAHGVPVVCSDADGLSENVKHGETGLVVPRRDSGAVADAV
ncbi:MAG: glycosyltransferase family 4 protein, partial [Acidimicrobiales bacterium]|nr:glycosyltransferase family 4 protein [Acidimicrobiales bacterium]